MPLVIFGTLCVYHFLRDTFFDNPVGEIFSIPFSAVFFFRGHAILYIPLFNCFLFFFAIRIYFQECREFCLRMNAMTHFLQSDQSNIFND